VFLSPIHRRILRTLVKCREFVGLLIRSTEAGAILICTIVDNKLVVAESRPVPAVTLNSRLFLICYHIFGLVIHAEYEGFAALFPACPDPAARVPVQSGEAAEYEIFSGLHNRQGPAFLVATFMEIKASPAILLGIINPSELRSGIKVSNELHDHLPMLLSFQGHGIPEI